VPAESSRYSADRLSRLCAAHHLAQAFDAERSSGPALIPVDAERSSGPALIPLDVEPGIAQGADHGTRAVRRSCRTPGVGQGADHRTRAVLMAVGTLHPASAHRLTTARGSQGRWDLGEPCERGSGSGHTSG
jgi:hypothetical protein